MALDCMRRASRSTMTVLQLWLHRFLFLDGLECPEPLCRVEKCNYSCYIWKFFASCFWSGWDVRWCSHAVTRNIEAPCERAKKHENLLPQPTVKRGSKFICVQWVLLCTAN